MSEYKNYLSENSVEFDVEYLNHIDELQRIRQHQIDKYTESLDSSTFKYTMEESKEIEENAEKIKQLLKKGSHKLPFEFIIEQLTHLGQAPCLLYDDNGHFAVSSDGVSQVSTEEDPADIGITSFVTKDMWKETPREALNYYLKDLKDL